MSWRHCIWPWFCQALSGSIQVLTFLTQEQRSHLSICFHLHCHYPTPRHQNLLTGLNPNTHATGKLSCVSTSHSCHGSTVLCLGLSALGLRPVLTGSTLEHSRLHIRQRERLEKVGSMDTAEEEENNRHRLWYSPQLPGGAQVLLGPWQSVWGSHPPKTSVPAKWWTFCKQRPGLLGIRP